MTFEFNLWDVVTILEIKSGGRVQQILIAQSGTTYQVAYWFNGERKEAWCSAAEIRKGYPV